MKDIKDNLVLLRQIAEAAYAAGIERLELIIALVIIGSAGNPYVASIEPTQRANLLFSRPVECSLETETMMQKTRWGLMQILGSVARSLGFVGWLPELVDPELNLELGAKYLAQLMERYGGKYGIEGVIAAYQTETPRRIGDRYVNQSYVDAVLKLMKSNMTLAAEIREMLAAEGTQRDGAATENVPNNAAVPTVDHTMETLNKLSKAQLVELAKTEFGLELSALSKKDTLITQILVAQADRLDFTAADLESQEDVSFAEEGTAVE